MISTSEYVPATSGHAHGHLRYMFAILIETGKVPTEELFDQSMIAGRDPVDWLCSQLWNCTDVLPSALCADLDHAADTYGQAAGVIHARRQR
jgi:hypothetical protein